VTAARADAPAKVNLRLRVLAREESGYHQIETLFCGIDLSDAIAVELGGDGIELDVQGADLGDVRGNLVFRAASAWYAATGAPPAVRIRLEKRIPHGAGLGGGSSDAATTLRLLDRLHGDLLGISNLLRIGATLGADVPFFVTGDAFALAWGRGERMLALDPLPVRDVVLVVPDQAMATAQAYAELARLRAAGGVGAPVPARLRPASFIDWDAVARAARNDFEPVLIQRIPALAEARSLLAEAGAAPALLSGSGSALFGIFATPEAAGRAASGLEGRFPAWRVIRSRTLAARPLSG
jgi:4-diphosphocytidyl-2-C-methyl-D-erythritol kinase